MQQDNEQLKMWTIYTLMGIFGLLFAVTVFICTWKLVALRCHGDDHRERMLPKENTYNSHMRYHWGGHRTHRLHGTDLIDHNHLHDNDDELLVHDRMESKSASFDYIV